MCKTGKEVRNIAHKAKEGMDILSAAWGWPGEDLLHL